MVKYRYDNNAMARQCGQVILHRDRYCGEDVIDIVAYAKQRIELNPDDMFYRKLLEDLEEKKTATSFIGIWQWHSSHGIGGASKVLPFFNEEVEVYKGSSGAMCYAQSAYFLLEDTGVEDATRRTIYRDLFTGNVFCFGYKPGTPREFASTWTEAPK